MSAQALAAGGPSRTSYPQLYPGMKVMPGPPWHPAPQRYRPSTGTGLSGQPRGPGRNGPMNSGWSSPWQKSVVSDGEAVTHYWKSVEISAASAVG